MKVLEYLSFCVFTLSFTFSSPVLATSDADDLRVEAESKASSFITLNQVLSAVVAAEGKKPAEEVDWESIESYGVQTFGALVQLHQVLQTMEEAAKASRKKFVWRVWTAGASVGILAGIVWVIAKTPSFEGGKAMALFSLGLPGAIIFIPTAAITGYGAIYYHKQKNALNDEIEKQFEKTKAMVANLCRVRKTLKDQGLNAIDESHPGAKDICDKIDSVELTVQPEL